MEIKACGVGYMSLNSRETQRTAIPKDKEKIKSGKSIYLVHVKND